MPTNIAIKNTNQRHQIKVTPETAETVVEGKTKKKVWKAAVDAYLKPGDSVDFWVGEDRRVIIQELPT